MIKAIVSLLFFSALICTSCDPVRRIDMRNSTNDTAEITWTLDEDNLMNNPFLISNSKQLKFTLHPSQREIKMSFGQGNWSPKEVEKLVSYLKSLEIKSATQNIKIDSLPLIKEFLLARRTGVGGAKIQILVSN